MVFREMTTTKKKMNYSFLGIENIDLSQKDLYKLGLVLSNWNTTKGYLRLLDIHSKEDWKTRLRNAWDNE
jgi:hypothetical protein